MDVPIGKPGGDRNGARHTIARLAPEAGGSAAAVVIRRGVLMSKIVLPLDFGSPT
jgi:hypothetical protein